MFQTLAANSGGASAHHLTCMLELFSSVKRPRTFELTSEVDAMAARADRATHLCDEYSPAVDERTLEVYNRARNPEDPIELRDLWLGRVEDELGCHVKKPLSAEFWRASRVRRSLHPNEVLSSRATSRFIKELFNSFFRDDLYGGLRSPRNLILSSGSVDEEAWGLPEALRECIQYALNRDWYGYSDSRGRIQAREAVAAYETTRIHGFTYGAQNIALSMGATFAISTLADFILLNGRNSTAPALCAIPNYPALVESVARRTNIQLVPLKCTSGRISVEPLIAALKPGTPLVLLQTVANPTGAAVPESELVRLIRAASPTTMILLDECHEWLGPLENCSADRAARNVIRISSLSKTWSTPGLKVGWIVADNEFIDEYYEYASTTFGGPPSLFYTMIELLARFERWRLLGLDSLRDAEVNEMQLSYGLRLGGLQNAYEGYRLERLFREKALTALRDSAKAMLSAPEALVIPPRYSINMAVKLPQSQDSYKAFRDLLRKAGVVVFPGILTFCFSDAIVRITTARKWNDLSLGIRRLHDALSGPAEWQNGSGEIATSPDDRELFTCPMPFLSQPNSPAPRIM